MLNCQSVATPMLEKLRLLTDMEEEPVDPTHYPCLVGKLIHFTHSHLQAVKRILRYISGTRDFGILYPTTNDLCVSGLVDADFTGDEENAKSTTRLVFRIGGAPITWMSKCQSCVALSSSKAKYMGLSAAAREAA
jgi:hypothetical protein